MAKLIINVQFEIDDEQISKDDFYSWVKDTIDNGDYGEVEELLELIVSVDGRSLNEGHNETVLGDKT